MNIAEAKEYIKDTVELYLTKDKFGDYRIPVVRQRPIFLLGAPGIGKTAIMNQIASELDIALVSYSMTHHTRQSALGLPFIREKSYDGMDYSVSEYTMSEIIASVYDTVTESGIKEGILFLDEINCVSETLYPSMLQFLQYKVFGKHTVPEGWVIVTAGNPPEFNKAVREFDVVTLDRLKVIEVEADYPAWKKYASEAGIHGAILGFIESNRDYFYSVETTAFGKNYITARGWEDLSDMILLYEEAHKPVTESLIGQYIRNDSAVKEFAAYYDLYNKYRRKYDISVIFSGDTDPKMKEEAAAAGIDERLAFTGLLADVIKAELGDIMDRSDVLKEIRGSVSHIINGEEKDISGYVKTLIQAKEKSLSVGKRAGSLTSAQRHKGKRMIALYSELLKHGTDAEEVKAYYNSKIIKLKGDVENEQVRIDNLFGSVKEIFGGESNEMLTLVTELTLGKSSADYFAAFGSASYKEYKELLMVGDRKENLRKEILDIL